MKHGDTLESVDQILLYPLISSACVYGCKFYGESKKYLKVNTLRPWHRSELNQSTGWLSPLQFSSTNSSCTPHLCSFWSLVPRCLTGLSPLPHVSLASSSLAFNTAYLVLTSYPAPFLAPNDLSKTQSNPAESLLWPSQHLYDQVPCSLPFHISGTHL